MKNEKWYERLTGLIPTNTVLISIIVFIITSLIVIFISQNFYDKEFWGNILVEAHGMLFDILVIGVFILSLNKLAEKRIENQKYLDEIDDFRGWKSSEAAFRIAGNIKRLNRNRCKSKINLVTCYLSSVDLYGENLRGANLTNATLMGADLTKTDLTGAIIRGANLIGTNLAGTDLKGTDLRGADLRGADLRGANLRGADLRVLDPSTADIMNVDIRKAVTLTLDQVSKVKTLYQAKLQPKFRNQIEHEYPHLLENPNDLQD